MTEILVLLTRLSPYPDARFLVAEEGLELQVMAVCSPWHESRICTQTFSLSVSVPFSRLASPENNSNTTQIG